MSGLLQFLARFHPVVVHLPIGMILGALLLQLLAGWPAYAGLRQAAPVVLLAGAVSAVLSCITGWLLAGSGDYDETLVDWHRWMGLALAGFSLLVWWRVRRRGFDRVHTVLSLGLLALVVVTGHLGGSLTHGSEWLALRGGGGAAAEVDSPIVNVQEARVYAEIIRPILRDNCYSCHGATRQKGGLRMDAPAALMKGGKDGVVIDPFHGDASELIKRLLLPEADEHHMPPREKRPLTERQILLLRWWIDQGADLSRRVAELKQPDSVRPALLSVQGARPRVVSFDEVPVEGVEAADDRAVEALRARGMLVAPVARGSHWLEVEVAGGGVMGKDFAAGGLRGQSDGLAGKDAAAGGLRGQSDEPTGKGVATGGLRGGDWVRLLLPLKKQLIALRAGGSGIGDSALAVIGQCVALRRLDLAGDAVSDTGLAALHGLTELRVLNLVGTRVSAAGVAGLRALPKLRTVYVYGSRVTGGDWVELRKVLPKVEMDTGGYSMPVLPGDTSVVKQGKNNAGK